LTNELITIIAIVAKIALLPDILVVTLSVVFCTLVLPPEADVLNQLMFDNVVVSVAKEVASAIHYISNAMS